jgi:hypothetical protein
MTNIFIDAGVMDVNVFDGTIAGPHAKADTAALEGRPCRAGVTDQPVLITGDDFAVGAVIDEQGGLGGAVDTAGMDAGDDVAANIGGNTRIEKETDGWAKMPTGAALLCSPRPTG